VLNPVIITDQIDTEGRFNVCRNHGAALVLDCFACVHLKVAVKNSAVLILNCLSAQFVESYPYWLGKQCFASPKSSLGPGSSGFFCRRFFVVASAGRSLRQTPVSENNRGNDGQQQDYGPEIPD
jgi:hypothetical protein